MLNTLASKKTDVATESKGGNGFAYVVLVSDAKCAILPGS
jgi:hypothetical protein